MHFNSLDVTKGIVEWKQVDWFSSDRKQGLHTHCLSHFSLHGRPEGNYEGPDSNDGVKADLGDGVHGLDEVLDKKVEVVTSHCSHTEMESENLSTICKTFIVNWAISESITYTILLHIIWYGEIVAEAQLCLGIDTDKTPHSNVKF